MSIIVFFIAVMSSRLQRRVPRSRTVDPHQVNTDPSIGNTLFRFRAGRHGFPDTPEVKKLHPIACVPLP